MFKTCCCESVKNALSHQANANLNKSHNTEYRIYGERGQIQFK